MATHFIIIFKQNDQLLRQLQSFHPHRTNWNTMDENRIKNEIYSFQTSLYTKILQDLIHSYRILGAKGEMMIEMTFRYLYTYTNERVSVLWNIKDEKKRFHIISVLYRDLLLLNKTIDSILQIRLKSNETFFHPFQLSFRVPPPSPFVQYLEFVKSKITLILEKRIENYLSYIISKISQKAFNEYYRPPKPSCFSLNLESNFDLSNSTSILVPILKQIGPIAFVESINKANEGSKYDLREYSPCLSLVINTCLESTLSMIRLNKISISETNLQSMLRLVLNIQEMVADTKNRLHMNINESLIKDLLPWHKANEILLTLSQIIHNKLSSNEPVSIPSYLDIKEKIEWCKLATRPDDTCAKYTFHQFTKIKKNNGKVFVSLNVNTDQL